MIADAEGHHGAGASCGHDDCKPGGHTAGEDHSLHIHASCQGGGRRDGTHECHGSHIGKEVGHDGADHTEHNGDKEAAGISSKDGQHRLADELAHAGGAENRGHYAHAGNHPYHIAGENGQDFL